MMQMLQATVSHDLTNPINNIDFFVDQMCEAASKGNCAEVKLQHKNIKNSINLVTSRIKDLLDQNLIQKNSFQARPIEFSPRRIIEDMKNLYLPQLAQFDVEIRDVFDESLQHILVGDGDRIQ